MTHPSGTHPDVPNKPNTENWVEESGGLPPYIRRIAKHLISDQQYSTSRAIATAVNTVKRWARGGAVTEGGENTVTAKTQAQAAKALASWKSKSASASTSVPTDHRSEHSVELRDFSAEERREAKEAGHAVTIGDEKVPSYPIKNKEDLTNAVKLFKAKRGKYSSSVQNKVRRHILERARELGVDKSSLNLSSVSLADRKTADGTKDMRGSAESVKKKVQNNPTTKTEKAGSSGPSAKKVRSPATGMYVEKFPEKNVAGVREKFKGKISGLSDGSTWTIPGSKNNAGTVKKVGNQYEVSSPGGVTRTLGLEQAANLAMQISSERV